VEHLEYEYKLVRERGDDAKFLAAVNSLASKGWRVLHYSYEAPKGTSSALLELSKPSNEDHTDPLNGPK